MLHLKPPAAQAPCKICGGPALLYGAVDFNRCCEIPGFVKLPPANVAVHYRCCAACGFLFTDSFDDWSDAEFKANIYNEGYLAVDPEYAGIRPRSNAGLVQRLFDAHKSKIRVLDYGGGNDLLCATLRSAGFADAVTFDPFVPEYCRAPEEKFDLVTCFETLEHMPDPLSGIGAIVANLADPGLVLFSTLLQPADIDKLRLDWWYVGPRNGHISLFSRTAMVKAWQRYGCQFVSNGANLHIAFRTLPDFARELQG